MEWNITRPHRRSVLKLAALSAAAASVAAASHVVGAQDTTTPSLSAVGVASSESKGIAMATTPAQTGYASVNGLKMYYEIHGTGQPLVLLHGGLSTIEVDFGRILPDLAKTRQVIAIEQQAHGHTADIDRPLNYDQMAEDTAELLRQLTIVNADFFGFSVGASIATSMALGHPDLVRKLVLATPHYNNDGYHPGVREGSANLKPEMLAGSPYEASYKKNAPNPGDWPKLLAKIGQMDDAFKGYSPEEVRSIKAPTLIILADSDIVRPEHAVEMFRLLGGGVVGDFVGLPNSRLAVLPGTTHITLVDRADWLLSMVGEFLDAPLST